MTSHVVDVPFSIDRKGCGFVSFSVLALIQSVGTNHNDEIMTRTETLAK